MICPQDDQPCTGTHDERCRDECIENELRWRARRAQQSQDSPRADPDPTLLTRVNPLYVQMKPPHTLGGRPSPRVQYDDTTMEFLPASTAQNLGLKPGPHPLELRIDELIDDMDRLEKRMNRTMWVAGYGVALALLNVLFLAYSTR